MKRFLILVAAVSLLSVSIGCKQESATPGANVGPAPSAADLQGAGAAATEAGGQPSGGPVGGVRSATPPAPPPE